MWGIQSTESRYKINLSLFGSIRTSGKAFSFTKRWQQAHVVPQPRQRWTRDRYGTFQSINWGSRRTKLVCHCCYKTEGAVDLFGARVVQEETACSISWFGLKKLLFKQLSSHEANYLDMLIWTVLLFRKAGEFWALFFKGPDKLLGFEWHLLFFDTSLKVKRSHFLSYSTGHIIMCFFYHSKICLLRPPYSYL